MLLTADDEGKAQDADSLDARARQNAVFEHGYFIGKLGRKRVVALYEDSVELPGSHRLEVRLGPSQQRPSPPGSGAFLETGEWPERERFRRQLVQRGVVEDLEELLS